MTPCHYCCDDNYANCECMTESTRTISFFVSGEPKGQPRPKAFARKFGAKWSARVYDPGTAEGWKSQIAIAARRSIPEQPIDGPVSLDLVFWLPRPKAHYRTGKYSSELRVSAPEWHTGKPDTDNLSKAVMDALTHLGFWHDDGQVCSGRTVKRYGDKMGCEVVINQLPTGDLYEKQVEKAMGS
jgi:Holliday junction resolvase RusA-like endonuclease